ncbi:MAG: parvulin-like peptidyl-prolyl isomerase [Kiritimatiellia bacterium]|jgi:parvulin-like peptidyl-prolyl isomerase
MRASHILLEHRMRWPVSKQSHSRSQQAAEELLRELEQRVQDGESFYDMAQMYSDCPSRSDGGDLGRFSFEQMSKKFSEAAFALDVGQMSGLVHTEFGVHLIRRTE